MDDFGTGYSSLEVLKTAPIDIVKIDRAFLEDVLHSSFDATFISFVVAICHEVEIHVCQEGVETEDEYNFYHAVLSEAVAYAEVDVESGHLMEAGGLWEPYAIELGNRTGFFEYLIQKNLEVAIRKEDREEYRKFLNLESMKEEFFQYYKKRLI